VENTPVPGMRYNEAMKRIWLLQRSNLPLLLVAYLTWGAVGAIWWSTREQEDPATWAGGGVLLLFALLLALNPGVLPPSWRHLYLAAQSVLVAGLLLTETRAWSAIPILFFILSAFAMLLWPHRRSLGWLWIGLFTLLSGGILVFRMGWENGLLTLLPYAGGYAFFGVFADALARAEEAHHRTQSLLAQLQEAHDQLRAYASRVEELAVAEERNRMAREMHDALGHRLTIAAVQLEGAERLIPSDPQRASRMVRAAREQVREALEELRETVAALRAPLEAGMPLPEALRRLADHFRAATGLEVHLALPSEAFDLPAAHQLGLYRAVQEALTNVQRHAQARQVWLGLALHPDRLTLLVSDDGRGFPPEAEARGFGLRGMRERIEMLGGTLDLEERPGGGAQLRITLPCPLEGADG